MHVEKAASSNIQDIRPSTEIMLSSHRSDHHLRESAAQNHIISFYP